jgi:hypothetical protein
MFCYSPERRPPLVTTTRTLPLVRATLLVAGLYLAGGGIRTLTSGRTTHTNYLHAPTSAAAAVIIGTLLVGIGTLGWRWLSSYL